MESIKIELSPPGRDGATKVAGSPEVASQVSTTEPLGAFPVILENTVPPQPVGPEAIFDPFKISHVPDLLSSIIAMVKETGQMHIPDNCDCQGECSCLTKKNRRIKLFNDRTFFAKNLVTTNSEGIKDYSTLIEHTKLIHEFVKDLLSCHQAYELAKRGFIDHATAAERERIRAKDKEYEPKYKEREASEAKLAKITPEEKKIQGFMKLGLDRATAEKIIFAK
jgi:hypothetical protein